MVDKDYFKRLAMGTSFRTPGFQPHDWLYAVSMESDLNGRFHDRQGLFLNHKVIRRREHRYTLLESFSYFYNFY